MIRLMIADDEQIERKALRYIITRGTASVDEIIEAANGKEVLELMRIVNPEILLLDIKMPGISGLEAARRIRESGNPTRIVFLTAYNYFDHVHEAIKLGVEDFIIKPASEERVLEVTDRICREIEEERTRESDQRKQEQKLNEAYQCLSEDLVHALALGDASLKRIQRTLGLLGIPFSCGMAGVMLIDFSTYPMRVTSENQRQTLTSRCVSGLRRQLKEYPLKMLTCEETNPVIIYFLCSDHSFPEDFTSILAKSVERVRKACSLTLRVGTGSVFSNFIEAQQSFIQAEKAVRSGRTSDSCIPFAAVEGFLLHQAEDTTLDAPSSHHRDIMEDTCRYITEHFSEDLTLEAVSERVHLSSFYFCRLFKECVGMTFRDYVTHLRISKAKALLTYQNYSIKEVSAEVGYVDSNYFSRVFHRLEGVTPSEYRRVTKKIQ